MNGKTATAIAIVLLAASAASASQTTTGITETPDERIPEGATFIDPSEVHQSILEQEPFTLPSSQGGSIQVQATDRVQETIAFSNGAGQEAVERPPNVWRLEPLNKAGEGLILSFNHTVRAWVATSEEASYIEPAADLPGTAAETLYEVHAGEPAEVSGPQLLSHIQEYRSVYAYVDTQYRDQYGSCCWADQVVYILDLLNAYFDDVQLEYYYDGGTVDTDFNTWDIEAAFDTLLNKPWNGADKRSYWSYKDFDGCEVGKATLPGWTFLIQHQPDACHFNDVPSTDAQRAYLTARELGKNNNAHPNDHWSDTESNGHEHRSIMKDSLWGHYHGCWSSTNLNYMASYLGTSVVESPC